MQPIYGIFREHIALVIRKKHLDAQHISYKREISHLSPRLGNLATYMIHRNRNSKVGKMRQ